VYEFFNTKDYNFNLFEGSSAFTDDSVMTMAVAFWLLKDPTHSFEALEDSMVLFAENCPCPMGGHGEGFYRWLFFPESLLTFDGESAGPHYNSQRGGHPYNSFGNGSLGGRFFLNTVRSLLLIIQPKGRLPDVSPEWLLLAE